jgi:DNA topoisomerase VI subunit B
MPHEQVNLTSDHLNRIAHCKPERAVEELIWNALDAGGSSVDVTFELNDLGSIHALEVRDHGSGIAIADLKRAFGHVGRSLKVDRKTTEEGRAFHGSEGFGRYRAVSICGKARWTTTFRENGRYKTYAITMTQETLEGFDYSKPIEAVGRATGTTVRLENIQHGHQSLMTERTLGHMTERLAIYLTKST